RLVWDAEAEALSSTTPSPLIPAQAGTQEPQGPVNVTPGPRARLVLNADAERSLDLIPTLSASATSDAPQSPRSGSVTHLPPPAATPPSNSPPPNPPPLGAPVALPIRTAGLVLVARPASIPPKAAAAQFLMSRAWEKQLAPPEPPRPWPWADFTPEARLS